MVPIKIQIKNFLSYGEELQTIDFSPYHLLCLSGKNGHGKSALLDAITWAIWGQGRKTSGTIKADHGLLRLGQTHMLVIIDFVCNNTYYRIRREFALTHGKPYAALDFGIVNEVDDTIAPLTEKKIRETQRKIENTLHLDYDSFVNSAFLRQGHANEFSKKSAKERKEILANILGLQRYEVMRKAANDKAREASTQKQHIIASQEKILTQLEKTEEINNTLKATKAELTDLAKNDKQFAVEQTQLQKTKEELFKQQEAEKQTKKTISALTIQQDEQQQQLRTTLNKWRTIHKQLLQANSAEQLKKEKEQCAKELHKWQEAFAQKLEKKEQFLKTKEVCSELAQKLKSEQQMLAQKAQLILQQLQLSHKQHEEQLTQCDQEEKQIATEQKKVQQHIISIDKLLQKQNQTTITTIEKQFEKRRNHYQQWITQANYIKNELNHIKQKNAFVLDDASPSCPLCEQNLSASRKKFLKTKLASNATNLTHRYSRLSKLINTLKPMLIEQHKHLDTLKKEHNQLEVERHKKGEAEKKLIQLAENQKQLSTKREQLTKLMQDEHKKIKLQQETCTQQTTTADKKIKEDPAYKEKHLELEQLHKAYNAITYDQAAHKKVVEQLQEIEKRLSLLEVMQKEAHLQDERKKKVTQLCLELKKIKLELADLEKKQKEYAQLPQELTAYAQKEKVLAQSRADHNAKKERLLQDKGRLEQQQTMLKQLKKEHSAQQKTIKELAKTTDEFQIVATALGKNGIQALLIEDAIPEIEQEANDLLSKLTDNQAQIFIESLRDLKSGGTRETLDIKISDAAGIRPYELFSGGEAFRIDFALRIAISKLLARRAGTSLQTLIIDEGFGSQDDEGLSNIMDAIYKIQDDFKKVIIVSHLPRLKDQFPVHFCVQKGPQGSHVNVIEQA